MEEESKNNNIRDDFLPIIEEKDWYNILDPLFKKIDEINDQSQKARKNIMEYYAKSFDDFNEAIKKITEFPTMPYIDQIRVTKKLISKELDPVFEEINKTKIPTKNKATIESSKNVAGIVPGSSKEIETITPINAAILFDKQQIIKEIAKQVVIELRKNKKQDNKINIFLTPDGTIYKTFEKKKLQYKAMQSGKPLELFRFLSMQNNNYVKTSIITKQTSCASDGAVRKAKEKFNETANPRLKLGFDIIDSKQGDGYRIDPRYRIKTTDQ